MSSVEWIAVVVDITDLVHLLELERDSREPGHELIQPLFPQLVVVLFLSVSLFCRVISFLSSPHPLFLSLPVLLKDPEIGLGLLELFC